MADGDAVLRSIIQRLEELPAGVVRDAAPKIAKEAETQITANVAAQRGPDGEAWQPGAEGQAVLTHAADAVHARAVGDTILITVAGPETRHHKGTAKGGITRRIIPTKKMPQPLVDAIRKILGGSFRRLMA